MVYNKLRSLLSHSRVPLRIATMNPRPTIYRVRIRQEKTSFFWTTVGIFTLAMGTKMTLNSTGDEERTIFLPMSLPKPVPQPMYERDDPVVKIYHQFLDNPQKQDEAKRRVIDIAIKAFHKERAKFGRDMQCSIMWLWFQYPSGPPPEYEQSGLVISRAGISWSTRQMHPYTFHRLKNALWPRWMVNSLYLSFQRIRDTIRDEVAQTADAELDDDSEAQSSTLSIAIPHPFYTGKVTFEETVGNFRSNLRKTWKAPPPPKGYVRVEGVIQITSEKLLVHVDVDATFNPETLKDFRFKTLKVRYVARMPERPVEKTQPPALQPPPKAEAVLEPGAKEPTTTDMRLKETGTTTIANDRTSEVAPASPSSSSLSNKSHSLQGSPSTTSSTKDTPESSQKKRSSPPPITSIAPPTSGQQPQVDKKPKEEQ